MTPEQAEHLRDLFMDARHTAVTAFRNPLREAYDADDAAVEAFNTALRECMK